MAPGQTQLARTPYFGLLQGHAHDKGVQKGFTAAIRGESRRTVNARLRTGADNIAAAFLQVRQGELGHEKSGAEIVPHRAVEIFNAVVVGLGISDEDAGIVHQHIETLEAPQ